MNSAGFKLDNSFKINHLSFGQKVAFDKIAKSFPDMDVEHPLDGFEVERPEGTDMMRAGFFLKAVPSVFVGSALDQIFLVLDKVVSRIV